MIITVWLVGLFVAVAVVAAFYDHRQQRHAKHVLGLDVSGKDRRRMLRAERTRMAYLQDTAHSPIPNTGVNSPFTEASGS